MPEEMNGNRLCSKETYFIGDVLCLTIRGKGVVDMSHYTHSVAVNIHNLTRDDCLLIAAMCIKRANELGEIPA